MERAFDFFSQALRLTGATTYGRRDIEGIQQRITISRLSALIAVGRSGSISTAAQAMGAKAPTVHRALKELQTDLGIPMIIRDGWVAALNRNGAMLARHADLAFRQIKFAYDELHAEDDRITGHITLGFLPASHSGIVPEAITRTAEVHPALRFSIVDGRYGVMKEALRGGDIDYLIGTLRDNTPEELSSIRLLADRIRTLGRALHPLVGKPSR